MKALLRFFADQPTLANVLTFLIVFLGLTSLSVIQRDNFPSVDLLEMTVTTRYPGASPEDVELNVTNKIEAELEDVDGIEKFTSFSMENISIVHIWIDREVRDVKKTKTDVRDAVTRVSDLPREVDEDPLIEEITTSKAIPIIEVGLSGDVPYAQLRSLAKRAEKELLDTRAVLDGIDLEGDWPGMRIVPGGETEETQKSMGSLLVAFAAAAVGIYLVLLLLFNSITQPLLVMFAVPFGLIGVIFAFALHDQSLGFLAMLGVIGLTGIVVNDSLILVNLANRLRDETPGEGYFEVIVEATKHRLRPILLTSVTTVAGLLPMAYGLGGSDPFSAPMALAMGYGILFATPLPLYCCRVC